MEKNLSLYVLGKDSGRLDSFVTEKAKISRTLAQKLIDDGLVTINGEGGLKSSVRIKEGDIIFVKIPQEKESREDVKKEDIPIDVIYEDEHIIVVNKERGMVVHPAAGHENGTLVNALLYHADEIEDVGEGDRPGIVHRLDKNTSGLLIAAKTEQAHKSLLNMFQERKIKKEYLAIVNGKPRGREGIINLPIGRDPKDQYKMAIVAGGRSAITKWKLQKAYKNYSIVLAFPETGRTHQIRVHFQYLGAPIVGDPEYGTEKELPAPIIGQALHAQKLSLPHPVTGVPLDFTAPLPQDMKELIDEIERE